MVSFELGDFVLIEGPDDSCWVAQLLEPYTGKLSEEVDDVDDDGPRISLRWLYTPDELPRSLFVSVYVSMRASLWFGAAEILMVVIR